MLTVVLFALILGESLGLEPPPFGTEEGLGVFYPGVHHTRASFKYKYVSHDGHIHDIKPSSGSVKVAATHAVLDQTLYKAAEIVSEMVRHMPDVVFQGMTRSHGVGIFTRADSLTVYPENAHLADRPECYGTCSGACRNTCTFDGRKYAALGGLTNSRSVILDHNVACDHFDPHHHRENIVVHEFGHLVMSHLPYTYQRQISDAYNEAKKAQTWKLGVYAMVNSHEFWAIATESFFMTTTRTDVTGGMNMCGGSHACSSEAASRAYLEKHDKKLFDVLSYAYTNNNPSIPSQLKVCE